MWNPFVVDDCNYLIKYNETSIIKIYLTNLKSIWKEEISGKDMVTRFEELNPLFDINSLSSDDILQKIKSLINDINPEAAITLTREDRKMTLDIRCKVAEFTIRCTFNLSVGDENMYFNEFTVPLMQSVQYLEIRQKKLFDLLEKKDKEIQEHQLQSGEILRKSLVTKKFDRSTAMENIPEQLFINVFGKSKVFYDTFSKTFGTLASVSSKIKIESTEVKPRKKLKLEKSGL